ncbi:hypothetical protein ACFL5V_07695 [Fibrobacterota bacterium]
MTNQNLLKIGKRVWALTPRSKKIIFDRLLRDRKNNIDDEKVYDELDLMALIIRYENRFCPT